MIVNTLKRTMSLQIQKLLSNAEKTEVKLKSLRSKLSEIRNITLEEKIKLLTKENENLVKKVTIAKNELIRLETVNGKKQYSIPSATASSVSIETSAENPTEKEKHPFVKKERKEIDLAKKPKEKSNVASVDLIVDVRKLDFRIGKIVDINKHPDADSLYVEKIDCGEDNPRTVVSGLVNHVPIEEMRGRVVMVLCNLKPVKMRGVTSEAMVMCASSPDKVEVLIPPSTAVPGDFVSCEGYPREPEALLNPKKKIFETCAPDLRTNNDRVACYKGIPLVVDGKGAVAAATLKGVHIK